MLRRTLLAGLATTISLRVRAAPPAHEMSRIDKLIRFVEGQKDMKFVRNGTEYACADAAKFLRGKMDKMGAEVATARDFIDKIASKSSMSGKPYQVKFADGRMMAAADFLGEELKRLEALPA
jgi:Family of unknown function (DUF5329)